MRLRILAKNAQWILIVSVFVLIQYPEPVQMEPITMAETVLSGVAKMWNFFGEVAPDHPDFREKNMDKEIQKKIQEIYREMATGERQILNTVQTSMSNLIPRSIFDSKLEQNLHDLFDCMNGISIEEQVMQSLVNSDERLGRHTLEMLANSVQMLISRIDLLIWGTQNQRPDLFKLLYQSTEQSKNMTCIYGTSPQQVLYRLFNAISIAQLRGYYLTQFSWMLLMTHSKGNFTTEIKLSQHRIENHLNHARMLQRDVIGKACRDYWRCDPVQHQEGETYVQITRLLQGYVENEKHMSSDGTCLKSCADYSEGSRKKRCLDYGYCSKQPICSGMIYNCEFIDSDMWICPAKASSNRRYNYIAFDNGMVFGQRKHCTRGSTKLESWTYWMFWRCDYCFCLCDHTGKDSDRYIDMRGSVSDVMNNRVVTGLRFVKKNKIIHLIVQQGRLLPHGRIDNTTLEWVQPANYNVLSASVSNGRDFQTLNSKNRTLDLDDMFVSQGYVLTGVRFRWYANHIILQIRVTKMDVVSGQLMDPNINFWVGSDSMEDNYVKRTELTLDQPHIPVLSPVRSIPDSESNQFIRFRESDRVKDASQTTVPFFDAQPVVPANPVPLSGAGLFHKGQPKFGGFIAPKVITYDFNHFND